MKLIQLTKLFEKNLNNLLRTYPNLESKIQNRIDKFLQNKSDPELKDHKLHGKQARFRAFSITGDIRVIYEEDDSGYYFLDIGTHNQVY